jgi:multidrug efflux system outer membrane protein
MRGATLSLACLALLVTSGCVQGPNYKRPLVETPVAYRGAAGTPDVATSLGDERWSQVFADPNLDALVQRALQHNYDLRIAAARIDEAAAAVGLAHADELPSVSATGGVVDQRSALTQPRRNLAGIELGGSAAWQLDFWGRYRRATEAARAELVATQWGRRAVMTTLVSSVANAYFTLGSYDDQLAIAERTLDSRRESLRLTQAREQGGVTSLVDVRQAEQLVYGASASIEDLRRQIAQQENLINLLLGENPGTVVRGGEVAVLPPPSDVPAGLPSSLLERRPDIAEAEQHLVAANAQIGVARAAYFPSIALTGSAGVQSAALSTLLTGASGVWAAAATAVAPIVTGGRNRAQVAGTEARAQEATLEYQQVVQRAFHDVSDALLAYAQGRAFREQEALLLQAAQDARRLADVRYQGGATSYLEVLDADTRLFNAELGLSDAELRERAAYVEIYRALGGGWQ